MWGRGTETDYPDVKACTIYVVKTNSHPRIVVSTSAEEAADWRRQLERFEDGERDVFPGRPELKFDND